MATLNQDERFVGVTLTFFDDHTPPRPARIDVSDRQPTVTADDPTVLTPSNIVVAADGMSMTFDVDAGATGSATVAADADVNLASGADTSLVLRSESVTVTPGPASQAIGGNFAFPTPSPKA